MDRPLGISYNPPPQFFDKDLEIEYEPEPPKPTLVVEDHKNGPVTSAWSNTLEPVKTDPNEYISISSKRFQDNEQGVDSEYSWVVDVASFIIQFFVIGDMFSFGVFLPVYVEAFGANQAAVSWIGSIGSFFTVFLGVLTGALADRYGNHKVICTSGALIGIGLLLASFSTEIWHLYLTQGVITGIGYSCGFIASVAVTGQWFKRYRGLAVGITMGGAGIGQFGMSQITNKLITSLGWRQALRYLALMNAIAIIFCALLIRRRLPCSRHLINWKNEIEFFKNRNFIFLCSGYLIFAFGLYIPITYSVIYSQRHGVSVSNSVLILSLMGITNGVGRMAFGEFADLAGYGKLPFLKLSMILGGIATYCWLACTNFQSILAYALIYGFVGGGAVSLVPSTATDILGVKKISSFIGILFTISSLGTLLSTPIAGFLYDAYTSYKPAIIFAATCQIGGVILLSFMDMSDPTNAINGGNGLEPAPKTSQEDDEENHEDAITAANTKANASPSPASSPSHKQQKEKKNQDDTDIERQGSIESDDLTPASSENNSSKPMLSKPRVRIVSGNDEIIDEESSMIHRNNDGDALDISIEFSQIHPSVNPLEISRDEDDEDMNHDHFKKRLY